MKHYNVTAAILIHNDEILCMQRGPSKYDYIAYKYEFPGGKVEDGESKEAALMRELREEMDLDIWISPKDYFLTIQHTYPDFQIQMDCYLCHLVERVFTRKEHIAHQWLLANRLTELDWAGADKPIVEKLMAMFSDRRDSV